MAHQFTDADLESYLDETLHPDLAIELEQCLKEDKQLLGRLSHINSRRDAGVHTLGEIWRRNQVGVPSRDQMKEYLEEKLSAEHSDYIDFRINILKCRYTIAHKNDLKNQSVSSSEDQSEGRRKKYFDSSAGLLRKKEE
ncbi:MAG: hypothetical protein AAGA30_16240 [Planctomycetota bacterium]